MSTKSCSCVDPGDGDLRPGRSAEVANLIGLLLLLLLLVATQAMSQETGLRRIRRTDSRPTLIILGGIAQPLSHVSLTDFWLRGPAASLAFTIDVQRWLAMGLEISGAQFYFDKQAFGARYPSVPLKPQNAGMIDAFLVMKMMFNPRMVFSPYLTAGLGATHWTGASYKEELPGQPRQIYYDIPRKTRLAVALTLGADFVLSSWFALVLEARACVVINDPELGASGALRGGARFRL